MVEEEEEVVVVVVVVEEEEGEGAGGLQTGAAAVWAGSRRGRGAEREPLQGGLG